MNFLMIGAIVGVGIVTLLLMAFVLSKLYMKSSKDMAFVRTGGNGEKVVLDGGAIVIPFLHNVTAVNMSTQRLRVDRSGKMGLVTKDKIRIDVTVDFFVRVIREAASISIAAQTLGDRSMDVNGLTELVESKFVAALRSTAATMDLDELHEKRAEFGQSVMAAVSEELVKNGLELESASLIALDQTSAKDLDENNVFDAQGMTKTKAVTEARRKERNDIEQNTAIAIGSRNLEAARMLNEQRQEVEFSNLAAVREIAKRQAEETAIQEAAEAEAQARAAKARAEAEAEAKAAKAAAEARAQAAEAAAKATADEARVAAEARAKIASEAAARDYTLAEQDRVIAISNKSKEESEAKAQATEAKAQEVKAVEVMETVRAVEIANREVTVARLEAEREAAVTSRGQVVAAEARLEAARQLAEALVTEARGRDEANKFEAAAQLAISTADAEGIRMRNEARNALSDEQRQAELRLELIRILPELIAQMVEPMRHISSMNIVDVNGFQQGGGITGQSTEGGSRDGSLADQLVTASLRNRAYAPLMDNILNQVGLTGANPGSIVQDVLNQTAGAEPKQD